MKLEKDMDKEKLYCPMGIGMTETTSVDSDMARYVHGKEVDTKIFKTNGKDTHRTGMT